MAVATTIPLQVLHLSLILGGQLRDADGLRLGKVDDLIVRLGSDDYPPVTGRACDDRRPCGVRAR